MCTTLSDILYIYSHIVCGKYSVSGLLHSGVECLKHLCSAMFSPVEQVSSVLVYSASEPFSISHSCDALDLSETRPLNPCKVQICWGLADDSSLAVMAGGGWETWPLAKVGAQPPNSQTCIPKNINSPLKHHLLAEGGINAHQYTGDQKG